MGHKDGSNVAVSMDMGPRRKHAALTGSMVLAQKQRSDVAAWKLDMDGKIVGCNGRAAELLGCEKPSDAVGKDFVGDVVGEIGKEGCADAIAKAVGGEEQYNVATPLVGKDGETVWLDGAFGPRQSGSGEVEGTVVSGAVAGEGSGVSESELLMLLERMGIAAWFTDKGGVVDQCNKSACELLGRSEEEMVGMNMSGDVVCE